MDEIEERLEMVEDCLYMYDAVADEGGNCQLAVGETQWNDKEGGMHPYTMAAFLLLSDGQIPKEIEIESVSVTPEGFTAIKLATYQDQGAGAFNQYGAFVVEHLDGCEFQGRSRFWEKDYSDRVTFLD
ncbi:MAG: hypothetical protein OXG60_11740 [Chloroflexi bacterium]|nr:hypothetical protein [Chloroflexota bacterium]